ncbi:MAG: hypothetical protein CMJ78_18940 [Planctomycetaceae bacterium]|nr:hypothetical protein [Planctomycetaceae bacterium]
MTLDASLEAKLKQLTDALIDQQAARTIVEPLGQCEGFWFGGGNMQVDANGDLLLVGRYRNHGDSRTGLSAGTRGLELAIFRSTDHGNSFQKELSFSRADLNVGDRQVISIEGSALRLTPGGVELFVSTEKTGIPYPDHLAEFLKPDTGVWTVDFIKADSIAGLREAAITTLIECDDSSYLHVKDPFLYEHADGMSMGFCTHPYGWTSSNMAIAHRRPDGTFESPNYACFPRGTTWDVAMSRGTALFDAPRVGAFEEISVTLLFYDGGESLRKMDEHSAAVRRPRGYSCEELGGVAYWLNDDQSKIHRLSKELPAFVSPWGTGCSRYVDVLATPDGLWATWQQSQEDCSQPLVANFLAMDRVTEILG